MADVKTTSTDTFVQALANSDFASLETMFSPNIRFRALIPRGLHETSGAAETANVIRGWFCDCDVIEVLASSSNQVGDRCGIAYRLRVRENGEWYVVAQQVFCHVEDGKIRKLDLLCSGFRPESSPTA